MVEFVDICLVLNTAPARLSSMSAPAGLYTVPLLLVLASSVVPVQLVGVEVCGHDGEPGNESPAAGAATQPTIAAASKLVEVRMWLASRTECRGVPGIDRAQAVVAARIVLRFVALGVDRARPAHAGHVLRGDLPLDHGDGAARAVAGRANHHALVVVVTAGISAIA